MRILVAGGRRGEPSPLAYWYELASNSWTEAPFLRLRRDSAAAAVVGGHVYVTGGRNTEYDEENACERFDPATAMWTEVANLREHRRDHGAAALGDRLYVAGGIRSGARLRSVECYEPDANQWTAAPDLPVALGLSAAFTIGGALWVAGEADDNYLAFRLDPGASRWEDGPVVCRKRRWIALAADDNAIYSIGGETPDGVCRLAERCELATGTIARIADLPTARRSAAAVTIDHRIVIIGGDQRDGTERADAEAFDTRSGSWKALEPMPWACASPAAVAL